MEVGGLEIERELRSDNLLTVLFLIILLFDTTNKTTLLIRGIKIVKIGITRLSFTLLSF